MNLAILSTAVGDCTSRTAYHAPRIMPDGFLVIDKPLGWTSFDVVARVRRLTVYRLELVRYEPHLAYLEVECSKGTYIRTLAHDLGRALGCGAHLAGLVRTQHGPFALADAVSLETLEAAVADDNWTALLQPL